MTIPNISVNYFAVLAATVASMIIGALWYSPVLFGNVWMRLSGKNKKDIDKSKQKGIGKSYLIAFFGSFVMVYVLAHFIAYVGADDIASGIQLGFWVWMGFIATVALGTVLWDGKPIKLYLINVFYQLVSLVVSGVILAVWK